MKIELECIAFYVVVGLTVLSGSVKTCEITEHLHTRTIGHKLGCDNIHVQLRSIVEEGKGELCGGVDGDERGI